MPTRRAVLQCGPQPWPAEARKHPAVAGRVPQAAAESPTDLLCHSERSEESFPLRTKGRGRTMPCKEEKDKRSAVKNLFWARLQILRRSSDLLRMTMLLFRIGFGTECPPRFSPGPAAGVASSMRAGPGHKAKDLEMPITCTLFENSAADWNMQLAATQVGNRNCFPVGW